VAVIDWWYHQWLHTVLLGLALFCAFLDPGLRRRFALSMVLTWGVGAWLYVAMPAMGPAYARPEAVAALRADQPRGAWLQDALLQNYRKVIAGRHGPVPSLNPTRGIAAMPSLHVGIHWLLALWTWTLSRRLGALAVLAALVTFVGSVVTGWHYAIDGWAGILLGTAAFAAARATECGPRSRARTAEPSGSPAG
jgi:hypothetical protein